MWKDHKVLCRRNTAMKEENGGNESAWYMVSHKYWASTPSDPSLTYKKSNNRLIHEALAQGLRFDRSFDMASTHFVHVILTSRPHHRRSKRYIVQSLTVEPIELAEELLIRNQEYDPDSVTRQGLWQGTDFLGALAVLTFRNSKGKSGNLLTPRTFYQKAKYSYNPNWRRCIMQAAAET